MRYGEIVRKASDNATREDMERLTDLTDQFIEDMREKHPEAVAVFLEAVNEEFNKYLTLEEAKAYVDAMENEDTERPRGQMWNKEEAIKAFTSAGYPQATEKYNEAEVYYTLNMVYSDFYPIYRENSRSYIDHAYLFLTDKDYKGRYSKAKWYARK
jgi:hypothetical protein